MGGLGGRGCSESFLWEKSLSVFSTGTNWIACSAIIGGGEPGLGTVEEVSESTYLFCDPEQPAASSPAEQKSLRRPPCSV